MVEGSGPKPKPAPVQPSSVPKNVLEAEGVVRKLVRTHTRRVEEDDSGVLVVVVGCVVR